jgi:hypothetical protein
MDRLAPSLEDVRHRLRVARLPVSSATRRALLAGLTV